jgi:acylglycerol lipase
VNHIEGDFSGVRNARIFFQAWLPDAEPKAALILLHGLGSHSGRYTNIVHPLLPRGYAVYGFDQIGHGRSDGARGRIERFEDLTETLAIFRTTVGGRQAGKPVFLFGHSMGGLIAAFHLLDHQTDFQGAVFSAPAVKAGERITPAAILLGRILSAVAPGAGVLRLNPDFLSHDPEVVRAYRDDPLVHHGKTPARLAAELWKAMRRVAEEAGRITLPFLALQGGADKIVDPGGAQWLYDRAGSKDKTLRIYAGLYHETFNEPERGRVLQDIETWLETHLGQ